MSRSAIATLGTPVTNPPVVSTWVLAVILAAAWRLEASQTAPGGGGATLTHASLQQLLTARGAGPVPTRLVDVLALERDLTAFRFACWTDLVADGVAACVWTRVRRGGAEAGGDAEDSLHVRLGYLEALTLVSDLEIDWPHEVDWVRARVRSRRSWQAKPYVG